MGKEIKSRPGGKQNNERERGDPTNRAATPRRLFGRGRFPALLEFRRQRRIANLFGVEIDQMKANAMLHFAFAKVVQTRRPLPILHQIVRHVLGEEDVPGIAAIHHPLRHVDPGPGDIGPPTDVGHFAHRSAVDAHPHRKSGCFRNACAISSAHRAGSSALWWKTSAIPSPVGSLMSCSLGTSRTCAVASTISVSWCSRSFCSSINSLE